MKTKSKSAQVRNMILEGRATKDIVAQCKVSPSVVYNMKYKMHKEKNPPLRIRTQVRPVEPTKYSQHLRAELATIELQINNLQSIQAFLSIRIQQLEMNGE